MNANVARAWMAAFAAMTMRVVVRM